MYSKVSNFHRDNDKQSKLRTKEKLVYMFEHIWKTRENPKIEERLQHNKTKKIQLGKKRRAN